MHITLQQKQQQQQQQQQQQKRQTKPPATPHPNFLKTNPSSIMTFANVEVSLNDGSSCHSQCTATTEACSLASSPVADSSSFVSSSSSTNGTTDLRAVCKQQGYIVPGILKRYTHCRPRPSRRSEIIQVRFHEAVEHRTILGRHQYSISELDACWFRGDEYAVITRSCCKQIKTLEKSMTSFQKERKYCTRGLESHTQLAALIKAQNRRMAWNVVLDEQDEQVTMGMIDDETIAQCLRDVSASCLLWAQVVGLQDQAAADVVFDDMMDEIELQNSSFY